MSHSLGKAFRPRNVAKTYAAIAKRHARILQIVATQLTILERWIEEKSSLTLEIDPTYVLRIKCYRCVETVPIRWLTTRWIGRRMPDLCIAAFQGTQCSRMRSSGRRRSARSR